MSIAASRNAACGCGSGRRYKQCCGRVGAPSLMSVAPPADAMSRLGQALSAGQAAEAERLARGLLERHPDVGLLWQALATAQTQQGREALEAWRAAARALPNDAASHNNLANACARVGRIDDAIEGWRRAATIQPALIEAHLNLGEALQSREETEEALAAYRRGLAIDPSRIEALLGVGAISLAEGRLQDAAGAYARALKVQPKSAENLVNLGAAVRGLGRVDEAIDLFRQALAISPDLAEAHASLGTALRLLGRSDEAEASLADALRLKPYLVSAVLEMAEARADRGDFEGAEVLFKRAVAIDPDAPEAWAGTPRVRRMTRSDSDWLTGAHRVLAKAPPPRRLLHLHYGLGKYHDDLGEYAEAFEHFRQANILSRLRRPPHDRTALSNQVDKLIGAYGPGWFAAARGKGETSARPIFIVGMPRSGTTLLEQMLASHPEVQGAGELSFWGEAAAQAEAAGGPDVDALGGLARDYLSRLEAQGLSARGVVDKMPANIMHLGLIHAALPNARILHMRRDPIDTCLSIYFQHFEPTMTYATDLGDLADYYRRYRQVTEHWRRTLPPGVCFDVDYESLVAEPRETLQDVLDFIGLPWSDACLDFQSTPRTIVTASKWQARQKIGAGSVGRWRRYQPFVEPLLSLGSAPPAA